MKQTKIMIIAALLCTLIGCSKPIEDSSNTPQKSTQPTLTKTQPSSSNLIRNDQVDFTDLLKAAISKRDKSFTFKVKILEKHKPFETPLGSLGETGIVYGFKVEATNDQGTSETIVKISKLIVGDESIWVQELGYGGGWLRFYDKVDIVENKNTEAVEELLVGSWTSHEEFTEDGGTKYEDYYYIRRNPDHTLEITQVGLNHTDKICSKHKEVGYWAVIGDRYFEDTNINKVDLKKGTQILSVTENRVDFRSDDWEWFDIKSNDGLSSLPSLPQGYEDRSSWYE